jgi:carboxyl-terminal processing protease
MINGMSASAFEILAASLQDYQRAIIVGEPSFGKSTGQIVIPLAESGGKGFVKVTTGKLYRLNGNTHQLSGVQPDILLPELLTPYLPREEDSPQAISSDTVDKKIVYQAQPKTGCCR